MFDKKKKFQKQIEHDKHINEKKTDERQNEKCKLNLQK